MIYPSCYKSAIDMTNGRVYSVIGQDVDNPYQATKLFVKWGMEAPYWVAIENLQPAL